MGGLAIVGAVVVGYLVAHLRRENVKFASSGWTLLLLIVGLGVRRLRRRLPRRARAPQPRAAQARQDAGHRRSSRCCSRSSRSTGCTCRRCSRSPGPLDFDFTHARLVHVGGPRRLRHRERGQPHRRARRARGRLVGARLRRVPDHRLHGVPTSRDLRRAPGAGARPRDHRGGAGRRVRGLPLVERGTRRASSWATPGRSRSVARWPASRCSARTQLLLPILAGLPLLETLSVIAQVISYRGFRRRVLRMAPIHHHFEVGGWSEFTVIVRFWLFAGDLRRARCRHLLRRLPAVRDRLMRALVIGLAATGEAVARRLRARGLGRDRDRRPARRRRLPDPRRGGRGVRRASSTRRRTTGTAPRSARSSSSCRARWSRESHPAIVAARAAGVAVRSEIDLAAERATAPIVAVTGTNGKTTVTSLTAAMLEASGRRAVAAGNIGRTLLDAVDDDADVLVAEVSSFQLAFAEIVSAACRGAPRARRRPPRLARELRRATSPPSRGSSSTNRPATSSSSTATTRPRRASRAGGARTYCRRLDRRCRGHVSGRRRRGSSPRMVARSRRSTTCAARCRTIARTRSRRRRPRSKSVAPTPGSGPRSRDTRPCPIASLWSASMVGCSTSTTRRRPTPTRRCMRSRRSSRSCCSRAGRTRVSTSAR